MNPAEIMVGAAEDGVLLSLSPSGGLSAKGEQAAVDRWLPAIRQSKAAIVLLLRPDDGGWSSADWGIYYDERAAIAEFEGGLARADAEAQAFACCVWEWVDRHPVDTSPDRCLACGRQEAAANLLSPYGAEDHGHAWLHSSCWPGWHEARKAEAVVALVNAGINMPPKFSNDFGKKRSA